MTEDTLHYMYVPLNKQALEIDMEQNGDPETGNFKVWLLTGDFLEAFPQLSSLLSSLPPSGDLLSAAGVGLSRYRLAFLEHH